MKLFLTFLFFLSIVSISSGLTVAEYDKLLRNDSTSMHSEFYIKGTGDGLHLATIYNEQTGRTPLFCPPEKLVLTSQNFVQIYKDQLKKTYEEKGTANAQNVPVPLILLLGLQSTFPCKPVQ